MDAIEALERTAEHWQWLAKTGSLNKEDWFGLLGVPPPRNCCFLCGYAGKDCLGCPLYGKWGTAPRCNDFGSPYLAWVRTGFASVALAEVNRKKAAQTIADLCITEAKRRRGEVVPGGRKERAEMREENV